MLTNEVIGNSSVWHKATLCMYYLLNTAKVFAMSTMLLYMSVYNTYAAYSLNSVIDGETIVINYDTGSAVLDEDKIIKPGKLTVDYSSSTGSLIINGTLILDGGGTLELDKEEKWIAVGGTCPHSATDCYNKGTIIVGENGAFNITGAYFHNTDSYSSKITVYGSMDIREGDVENHGDIEIKGGTLKVLPQQLIRLIDQYRRDVQTSADGGVAVMMDASSGRSGIVEVYGDLEWSGSWFSYSTNYVTSGDLSLGTGGGLEIFGNLSMNPDDNSIRLSGEKSFINVYGSLIIPGNSSISTTSGGMLNIIGQNVTIEGKQIKLTGTDNSSWAGLKFGYNSPDSSGSINSNIINSLGRLSISGGTWTLTTGKTINSAIGYLDIGDTVNASNTAKFIVEKGATILPPSASTYSGIHILKNGIMEVDVTSLGSSFYSDISDYYTEEVYISTFATAIGNAFTIDKDGTLRITGLNALRTETLKKLSDALEKNNNGHIELIGTIIPDLPTNSTGTIEYIDVKDLGDIATDETKKTTVVNVPSSNTLTGAYKSINLESNSNTLVINSALTLTGGVTATSSQVILVADSTGKTVCNISLTSGATVTLGNIDLADDIQGSVNNIELGQKSNDAQSFVKIVSNITANIITGSGIVNQEGNVIVTKDATLTANYIGTAEKPVAEVSATLATIKTHTSDNNGTINAKKLSLTNTSTTADKITVGEDGATVSGGTLDVAQLITSGNAVFKNGLTANLKTVTGIADITIEIGHGDDSAGTQVTIGTLNLNGATLLVDPAWGTTSANVVIDKIQTEENLINGSIGVGQNSYLTLGTTNLKWITELVEDRFGGLSSSGVNAALGIFTPVQLGAGSALVIDGTKSSVSEKTLASTVTEAASQGKLIFAENSLLVVNADAAKGDGAITVAEGSTATAQLHDGAKLMIVGGKDGQRYTILGDNITAEFTNADGTKESTSTDNTAWSVDTKTLVADTYLVKLTGQITADGEFVVDVKSTALPNLDPELNAILEGIKADTGTSKRGLRFLSRAISSEGYAPDAESASKAIASAARPATQAAVPQMALLVSDAASVGSLQRLTIGGSSSNTLLAQRMDGTAERAAGDFGDSGLALWIMPLYQSQKSWAMPSGNFHSDWRADIGGISLGADMTFASMFRAGVSFHTGGGYAKGGGDLASTENRTNFWGIGGYGGIAFANALVAVDGSYTRTHNAVEQEMPRELDMGNFKADIVNHLLAMGLRGEYRIETPVVDIVPHAGIRYTFMYTEGYGLESEGRDVLISRAAEQNIWTFPVGLGISKEISTGRGWYVKPSLDFTIIPATGDVYAHTSVRFTGTPVWADLDAKVMDYVSYRGTTGVEFGTGNVKFGLNYSLTASERTIAHTGQLTARIEF